MNPMGMKKITMKNEHRHFREKKKHVLVEMVKSSFCCTRKKGGKEIEDKDKGRVAEWDGNVFTDILP